MDSFRYRPICKWITWQVNRTTSSMTGGLCQDCLTWGRSPWLAPYRLSLSTPSTPKIATYRIDVPVTKMKGE
jgi:hypothetical protein